MRVLADENVDGVLVRFLRNQGHDIFWMAESGPGTGDAKIVSIAQSEGRVILTFDRDFGELIFRHAHAAPGVVFLRLSSRSPEGLLESFRAVWPRIEQSSVGHFIVVRNGKVRIRPMARSASD